MALSAGTRLGSYEVLSAIGAGGMGEVYRARDTRLKREVAIKVLPDAFLHDPDRLARFRREAELLATLNHPNIAAVYGLEQSEGVSAIVLELVEGETLAEVIAGTRGSETGSLPQTTAPSLGEARQAAGVGPRGIPIDEALPIARQIAAALEAAHEKGVIHRDLKPSNVKVTPEGTVKVLDFGLAKMLETEVSASALTMSPTLSVQATNAGVILGTAAYMSPEQARGRPVDRRTDIWAFGCVLFEMLTGRRTFDVGETVSDAVAAILKNDPDWSVLPVDTPAHIRTLLRRCLQKDPQRRLPHIGLARIEIDEGPAEAAAAPQVPAPTELVAQPRSLWKRAMPVAIATIVASALTSVAWNLRPSSPATPLPITRFSLALAEGQQFGFTLGTRQMVAISPDGTQMGYLTNLGLYVRSMSDLQARTIPGIEVNIFNPVFSPDGRSLAFYSIPEGRIKRIAVSGGAAVAICQADLPFGMSWSAAGILFGQGNKGIMRVSPDGGKPEQLVSVKGDQFAHGPQILPDGQTVLFTLAEGTSPDLWDRALVVAHSLKSGERKTLIEGGSDARYLRTGHLVYALGGVLYAVPFDPQRLQITPGPVPIVEGVRRATAGTAAAHFSVSDTGSLIYVPGPAGTSAGQQELALIDRKAAVEPLKLPPGPYGYPRISPDGKRVAFGTDNGKEANVWIYDLSGTSSPLRITFGGRNRFPIWSADGQRVAFQSDREGDLGIFWQRADGTGTERLTKADQGTSHVPESWSPKEDRFSYSVISGSGASLWIYSVQDKKATPFGDVRASNPLNSVFSPDGRWIAYTLRGPTGAVIYVQPFPATGARFQISKDDIGHHPLWSPDGKELFYFPGANALVAVSIATQPSFAFGTPVPVPGGFTSNTTPEMPRNHDVTPDGKLLVVVPSGQRPSASPTTTQEIRVVLNWFEEVKQRVPVE